MKILHISDIHFGVPCFKPKKLLSKRFVGMLNYLFNRRRIYQYESLKKLGPSIEKRHIDYIIFTGDFATTSLEEEFVFGKNFLNSLEKYVRKIFIVPGNHDLYIRETAKEKLFERFFSDYLGEPLTKGALFPYSKEIDGEIVIVGVNSAMPMPFYSSEGFVSLDTIDLIDKFLEKRNAKFKIMISHYPLRMPPSKPIGWFRDMKNSREFLKLLKRHNFNLYLHGHIDQQWFISDANNLPLHSNCGSLTHKGRESYVIYDILSPQKISCEIYGFSSGDWHRTGTKNFEF